MLVIVCSRSFSEPSRPTLSPSATRMESSAVIVTTWQGQFDSGTFLSTVDRDSLVELFAGNIYAGRPSYLQERVAAEPVVGFPEGLFRPTKKLFEFEFEFGLGFWPRIWPPGNGVHFLHRLASALLGKRVAHTATMPTRESTVIATFTEKRM